VLNGDIDLFNAYAIDVSSGVGRSILLSYNSSSAPFDGQVTVVVNVNLMHRQRQDNLDA